MRNFKLILIVLLGLLLFQYLYFGTGHCDQCRFGESKMKLYKFFNIYTEECLVEKKTFDFPNNITIDKATPPLPLETLEFKVQTPSS